MQSCAAALQERHHELLEDYGRQARVVEMTRQMQKDANLAVADAQHAAREVSIVVDVCMSGSVTCDPCRSRRLHNVFAVLS